MDCCVCSPITAVYRPPRNTICPSCYEGARGMVDFLNGREPDRDLGSSAISGGSSRANQSSKGVLDGFKWMKEMKEMEESLNERVKFLEGLVVALKEGMYTDILVIPGSGPPIRTHKALLASRSEIFRTMLGSDDECKAPADDTISLPEFSHVELQCLLEFLYCADLTDEQAAGHAHSLLVAADKYEIPFLKRFCEARILDSLSPSNALGVLEVSELGSSTELKQRAMRSVVDHAEDVIFSAEYETFAMRNAHLGVEIARALLMEMKDKSRS